MSDRFVVISGHYDNKTYRGEFIQAIGTYNDVRQAYGVALLQLSDFIDEEKGEMITPPFALEGDTGYGIEIKHEKYTDYCYVLFCDPDDFWGRKKEGNEDGNPE